MGPRLEPAGLTLGAASAGLWVLGPPSSGSCPGQTVCSRVGSVCCLPSWVRTSLAQCRNQGGRTGADDPWWECDPTPSTHRAGGGGAEGQGTQMHLSSGAAGSGQACLRGKSTDLCLHSDNPLSVSVLVSTTGKPSACRSRNIFWEHNG